MITPKQAYDIMFGYIYKDCHTDSCVETDKYYVFSPVPKNLPASTRLSTGTMFPVIDKKTGAPLTVSVTSVGKIVRRISFVKNQNETK